MWLYEANDLCTNTVQELFQSASVSSLRGANTDANMQKLILSIDNITFVQEKTEYFKRMRQEQNIQRNDFSLEYDIGNVTLDRNCANLSVIEHISFHYSDFPDVLSELVNYYEVELIRFGSSWYVSDVIAINDDFDTLYKNSNFTLDRAEEIIAAQDAQSLYDDAQMERYMNEESLTESNNTASINASKSDVWYSYNADNATAYAYTYVSQMFGLKDWGTISAADKATGRTYYNQNFRNWGEEDTDCQNFASQCIWAGFNGSNSLDQIYRKSGNTATYSPIMDNGGSYRWCGSTPDYYVNTESWSCCNGQKPSIIGFRKYLDREKNSGDPDMIVESGQISGSETFSKVYRNLKGAVLHVRSGGHAVIVTDVKGPGRDQVLVCAHTSDRKAVKVSDFWDTGLIYYIIPKQIRVRKAPDIKITASLPRPVAAGSSLSLGGNTDVSCKSITMTVTTPGGSKISDTSASGYSIRSTVKLSQKGLYVVTITAKRTNSSTPVVYVYTVRTY